MEVATPDAVQQVLRAHPGLRPYADDIYAFMDHDLAKRDIRKELWYKRASPEALSAIYLLNQYHRIHGLPFDPALKRQALANREKRLGRDVARRIVHIRRGLDRLHRHLRMFVFEQGVLRLFEARYLFMVIPPEDLSDFIVDISSVYNRENARLMTNEFQKMANTLDQLEQVLGLWNTNRNRDARTIIVALETQPEHDWGNLSWFQPLDENGGGLTYGATVEMAPESPTEPEPMDMDPEPPAEPATIVPRPPPLPMPWLNNARMQQEMGARGWTTMTVSPKTIDAARAWVGQALSSDPSMSFGTRAWVASGQLDRARDHWTGGVTDIMSATQRDHINRALWNHLCAHYDIIQPMSSTVERVHLHEPGWTPYPVTECVVQSAKPVGHVALVNDPHHVGLQMNGHPLEPEPQLVWWLPHVRVACALRGDGQGDDIERVRNSRVFRIVGAFQH